VSKTIFIDRQHRRWPSQATELNPVFDALCGDSFIMNCADDWFQQTAHAVWSDWVTPPFSCIYTPHCDAPKYLLLRSKLQFF
jgi:hypothetical protein